MLSRKVEDYLETMLNIISKKGYVRTKDLAFEMNVKPPSVTEMLKKLSIQGLITYKKYEGAQFTPAGLKAAEKIKLRHDIFEQFLKIISVPTEIAEKDACVLEHHLSTETITQLSCFTSFLQNSSESTEFLKKFKEFYEDK